jgi:hypothetical protein
MRRLINALILTTAMAAPGTALAWVTVQPGTQQGAPPKNVKPAITRVDARRAFRVEGMYHNVDASPAKTQIFFTAMRKDAKVVEAEVKNKAPEGVSVSLSVKLAGRSGISAISIAPEHVLTIEAKHGSISGPDTSAKLNETVEGLASHAQQLLERP